MKIFASILILIFGFTLQTSAKISAQKVSDNKLAGRWYLTFNLSQNATTMVVDFKVSKQGKISVDFLQSSGNLVVNTPALADNQLKLNGKSQLGDFTIIAVIEGEKMNGTFDVGLFSGAMTGIREPVDAPKVSRISVFDKVWQTINDKFYDPDFNGVNWQAMRAKYRPLVMRSTTDGELKRVVEQMFKELKVSHLYFTYTPYGYSMFRDNPYTPKDNNTSALRAAVKWKTIMPDVGYLRIERFVETPEAFSAFDKAFAEIGKLPNLIIDVRGNPGGTGSLGMRLADYLFDKPEVLGFFSTREGLKRHQVKSIDELDPLKMPTYTGYSTSDFWRELDKTGVLSVTSGGRTQQPYHGRIVVLVDEGCFSATEALLGIIKERRIATIIGRKTPGGVLSGGEMSVGGYWKLFYPKADFRTLEKVKLEGVGIEPDIVLDKNLSDSEVLKRAVDVLHAKS